MKKYWILLAALLLIVVGLVLQFTVGNMFSYGDTAFGFFAAGSDDASQAARPLTQVCSAFGCQIPKPYRDRADYSQKCYREHVIY